MKFTKLAKSEKFEYMMLSRLIQDAKYFIDHPDLKHLWARTLDEHIKQMKEQYTKLDPKPEWTSEEEINSLAKQMKEAYTNHWNEVHPDNKIEAAIQQPNKPKPTTILPDNMQWAWDPEAADWVAVLKDNTNTTPPLYDPNNQNVVNQTTNYMSTVKSACLSKFLDGPQYSKEIKIEAGLIKDGLVKYAGFDFNRGTKYIITTKGLEVLRRASEAEHNEALNEREKLAYMFGFNTDKVSTLDTTGKVIKSEEITDEQLEESWNKYYPLFIDDLNNLTITEENYSNIDPIAKQLKNVLNAIFNNSEIDKNLDINTYIYTTELFKDMVFENIKKGKSVLLQGNYKSAKKWTICEADGIELGEVEADSELNAKVKFGIEHPEYTDSQSICAKEVKAANKPFESTMGFYTYEVLWQDNDDKEGEFIEPIQFKLCQDADIDEWSWQCEELFGKQYFHGFLRRQDAMDDVIKELNTWGKIKGDIKQVDSLYTGKLKQLHSKYEETTESHEPYINPSETPNDHIILENHDGWVNTASFEDDIRKQFQHSHQKLPNSDRDLALLEEQILQITDEDARDTVRKIFDEFQFSDKEAAEKRSYTEEEKRMLPLFRLLNEHVAKKEIQLEEDPQKNGNIVATGQAEVINDLEHQIKDLGFYCEPIAEITDEDYIGYDIYSLRIFTK